LKCINKIDLTTAWSECRPAVTFFAGNGLGSSNQLLSTFVGFMVSITHASVITYNMNKQIIKITIIIIILINNSLIFGGDTMLPGTEKLARKMIQGVDMVKLVLYKVITDDYSKIYKSMGEDYYKNLAGATVNEIFNDHNEMSLKTFNENKELIIEGIKNIGKNHSNLKRPITDALRVFVQANFMLSGTLPDNYLDVFNKADERGIFIKGGDKPEPDTFLEMVNNLAKQHGIY
jgi:hypothetical protein